MVKISIRGTAALLTTAAIVAVTLIWLPAYRLFLAISIGIGVQVAGILYLWRRLRPVREEDVENKRPLGLSLACGIGQRGGVVPGSREKIQPATLAVLQ